MSTTALVGALISGLVWLGVLSLVALGWVDDRRREDEDAFNSSRPPARGRVAELDDAPQPVAPDAPTVVTPAPSEPTVASPAPPEPTVASPAPPEPKAEPPAPARPREPESGGSWRIHTLHNGEGSRTPPDAPRPDAAGDGS
jgi:hypothetical protein